MKPLEIPLRSAPGKPPELGRNFGFLSFSHCCDALLIGWSRQKIGVDIERTDRSFQARNLMNRYFSNEEKSYLSYVANEELRVAILHQWLRKEAAIKWQRGNIAKDLSQWNIPNESWIAKHKQSGQKVSIKKIHYGPWSMAIACGDKEIKTPLIICTSKNLDYESNKKIESSREV